MKTNRYKTFNVSQESAAAYYDAIQVTTADGLVSVCDNQLGDSALDLSQSDATKRPQNGYLRMNAYNADNAIESGGFVTSIPNTEIFSGAGGALTMSSNVSKVDGIEFDLGEYGNLSTTARTLSMLTHSFVGKIPTIPALGASAEVLRLGRRMNNTANNNGFRLSIDYNHSSGYVYFIAEIGNGSAKISAASAAEALNISAFNAKYADGAKHIVNIAFLNGFLVLEVDGVQLATTTSTSVITCVIQALTCRSVSNESATGVKLHYYQSQTFDSYIESNLRAALVTNKENYAYNLPKIGIAATGAAYLETTYRGGESVTNISIGAWFYVPEILKNNSSTNTEMCAFGSNDFASSNRKGVTVRVSSISSRYFIRFNVGDDAIKFDSLSTASFQAKYGGKWVYLVGVKNGTEAKLYVNGVLDASGTVSATVTFPADGWFRLLATNNLAYISPAGFKIQNAMIYERALTAKEIKGLFNRTRLKYKDYVRN